MACRVISWKGAGRAARWWHSWRLQCSVDRVSALKSEQCNGNYINYWHSQPAKQPVLNNLPEIAFLSNQANSAGYEHFYLTTYLGNASSQHTAIIKNQHTCMCYEACRYQYEKIMISANQGLVQVGPSSRSHQLKSSMALVWINIACTYTCTLKSQ